jgi:hypothetical protein
MLNSKSPKHKPQNKSSLFTKKSVVFLILCAIISCNTSPDRNAVNSQVNNKDDTGTKVVGKKVTTTHYVPYKIIHKNNGLRYDGGLHFLVLVNTINLKTEAFKDDVKAVISEIAQKEGKNIAVDVFDSKSILEAYNGSNEVNFNSGKELSKNQYKQLSRSLIASYCGGIKEMLYLYQLDFFPSATTSDGEHGKYASTEAYEPDVNNNYSNESDNAIREVSERNNKMKGFSSNCLSSWNGSCAALVTYVKENMNNPASFKHVSTQTFIQGDHAVIIMKYSGTNAYGAIVTAHIKAKVSSECEIMSILETE